MNNCFCLWVRIKGQGFHSVREVREFFRGPGKVREIRDFLENARKENFYSCNFLT